MISFEDNYLIGGENRLVTITIYSSIGQREEQQDSAGYVLAADSGLAVVCDGMGGLSGGKLASRHVVERMLKTFEECAPFLRPRSFMKNAAITLDAEVHALTDQKGNRLQAGTTFAAVLLQDRMLYWASAGDSRIYLLRNGLLRRLTTDHTYAVYLEEMLHGGRINQAIYDQEKTNGAALISFLGVGGLKALDSDVAEAQNGDVILMMTDGLYKLLSEETICSVLCRSDSTDCAMEYLDGLASESAEKQKIERDNLTLALIVIK